MAILMISMAPITAWYPAAPVPSTTAHWAYSPPCTARSWACSGRWRQPALIPVLTPQYNAVQQSTAQMWDYIDRFGGAFFNTTAHSDYSQWSQELQMVGTADNVDYAVGAYYFSDEGEFRNSLYPAQPIAGHNASSYDNETEAWAGIRPDYHPPGDVR